MAGCIGDVDLDRMSGNLTSPAGQEDKRSCNDDDDDDQENEASRHCVLPLCWSWRAFARPSASLYTPRMRKLSERLDRPIVLVGLMGAGKSTVGKRLAKRLGLPFVDSDDAIEDAAGYSAAEMFERYGEADFRDGERRLVARLIDGSVRVIATGGGVYIDPRTRKLLNERAITIWLDAPVDTLAERTGRRDTRPLLRDGDREATLGRLSVSRGPAYAEAHIRVRSGEGAHRIVVDSIVTAVETYLAGGSSAKGEEAKDRSSPA